MDSYKFTDDEGKFLSAAAACGKDLTSSRMGLKDMPVGDDDALTDGPCCPSHCTP